MKVKEKTVELIELFYDLIYVYAISKLTLLIEEPEGGIIPASGFFRYLVVCFVMLGCVEIMYIIQAVRSWCFMVLIHGHIQDLEKSRG